MKILYGTTNKAKLAAMKNALKDFDIELIGLSDMEGKLPQINESGATPLENAEIKAEPIIRRLTFRYFHATADCTSMNCRNVNSRGFTSDV